MEAQAFVPELPAEPSTSPSLDRQRNDIDEEAALASLIGQEELEAVQDAVFQVADAG